jgi:hypothetical protein
MGPRPDRGPAPQAIHTDVLSVSAPVARNATGAPFPEPAGTKDFGAGKASEGPNAGARSSYSERVAGRLISTECGCVPLPGDTKRAGCLPALL